jgi:hypothetical protein
LEKTRMTEINTKAGELKLDELDQTAGGKFHI